MEEKQFFLIKNLIIKHYNFIRIKYGSSDFDPGASRLYSTGLLNYGSADRMALDMPVTTDISHVSCDFSTCEIWFN